MKHLVYYFASFLASSVACVSGNSAVSNATASDSRLRTWWHDNGEINYQSVVQEQNVRQSHLYSAWVKSNAEDAAE